MSDGLNMQERVGEPESELEPGVMAVKSRRSPPVRFLVNATGVVDTSISGGINTFGGFNQGVTAIAAAPYQPGTDLCLPVSVRLLTPAAKPMFVLAYTAGLNNPGARIMVYGYFNARRIG